MTLWCSNETTGFAQPPHGSASVALRDRQVCEIALGVLEERLRALPSRGASKLCAKNAQVEPSVSSWKILANKRGVHNQPHAVPVSLDPRRRRPSETACLFRFSSSSMGPWRRFPMGKRPGSLAAYTKIWKCRLCPCCPTGDKVLQGDHPNVPRERLHQPTGLQVSKMDTPCLACPAAHLLDG